MAQIIITYWRDIPSQVTAKIGRKAEKKMLSDRFQEAIDMAAMRSKAADSDDYLEEWRRGDPIECDDDLVAAVTRTAEQLEADYDQDRIKALIASGGTA
ncbi:MAG: virulence factor [Pseudomonadota bacterium]